MYEQSLTLNDVKGLFSKGNSSDCPTPVPSSQAITKVYKIVNYNAGSNIDNNDTPKYNMDGVKRALEQFYKLSCQGWGYAPNTKDEATVVNAVSKNSGVNAEIVKLVLREWYYARRRQDIYDKPYKNANTSPYTSDVDTNTKPGKETEYKTPEEGGGSIIDRARAFVSEPLVWGSAVAGTILYIVYKRVPNKSGV